MKISEILTKTLETWGPNGEHWIQGDLGDSEHGAYCLYGGIGFAITGYACYPDGLGEEAFNRLNNWDLDLDVAMQGFQNSSDGKTYRQAEKAVQKSIDKLYPSTQPCFSLANFNDSHKFEDVKAVVCNALKTALIEEEKEQTGVGKENTSDGSSNRIAEPQ